ncbi:hypothetical protein D3C73_1475650 [compost metagenome]
MFQSPGAIDLCSLVEIRVNAGNGRQVNDRPPAAVLPYPRPDEYAANIVVIPQKIDRLKA